MAKLFKNPKNGELNTAKHWAEEYEYKNANTFHVFANKCMLEGRPGDAYCLKEERKKRGIEKSTEAPLYTNPTPNEKGECVSKTAIGWAKHLKLSKSGFMDRVRKFDADDPRIYETRGEAERKKKAIMATKGKKSAKRGPVMPYIRRRGQLTKIKIGTWEENNIPDRWSHIKGEP